MSKLKSPDELFAGRHLDREVIDLCSGRYLLQAQSAESRPADGGMSPVRTTILRWVQRYAPEFVKRSLGRLPHLCADGRNQIAEERM
ncbi:hypothetical protein LMG28727_06279 [Paraburkholderia kirstenboschensis]|uniref:IS6 family transposase n=1 Tax=Paraburkholderia kirstenboschensis TaxID=1245436 RepID=UPI000AEF33BD|nr:IS6 family transposase [Paraburkholderia kirstenboschensis]CAD6557105.1 hypothetical protein LMG28727_06279 [Paraburkholderia kirstenboschensis]